MEMILINPKVYAYDTFLWALANFNARSTELMTAVRIMELVNATSDSQDSNHGEIIR